MKILLTEDQERMRETIHGMVQKSIVPRAAEIDAKDEIPKDIIKYHERFWDFFYYGT